MDIREKTRRTIKTPGGYEVIIRKLNMFSFMEIGNLPDVFTSTDPKVLTKKVQTDPNILRTMIRISLVDGVVGGDLNIVDKSPRDCVNDEISYKEVPQDDVIEIFNQVMDFSDMTGGEAEKAIPFSGEDKTTDSSGPNGSKV